VKELQGLLSDDQKKARADALKAGKKRRELAASDRTPKKKKPRHR